MGRASCGILTIGTLTCFPGEVAGELRSQLGCIPLREEARVVVHLHTREIGV